jgi:branched-chain amino acid transport system permease protein
VSTRSVSAGNPECLIGRQECHDIDISASAVSVFAEKAGDYAGNLSLGQQRIVEIARALAADPILLMLDEPAAGLRQPEKKHLADLLRALRTSRMKVLLVEHDMEFVMGLVDQIVVLDFGRKIAQGLPNDTRNDRVVQEAYLGAAM